MKTITITLPDDIRLGSIQFRGWNSAWTVFLCAEDPALEAYVHGYATGYATREQEDENLQKIADAAIADYRENERKHHARGSEKAASSHNGSYGAGSKKLSDIF